ncbi:hypothetical protein BGZ46_008374 [Entomortierella lignicola]|nr:hypothetical protein BGZ46_008374 [Entomortierella lignicola]
MSSSNSTVKDLYKVIAADLTTYLTAEKSQEQEQPRETIQQYLDRFIRNNTTNQQNQNSVPTTPSSAGGSSATPTIGNLPSGNGGTQANLATTSAPTTPGGVFSSSAAGQRQANELWYQSLTNNTTLQNSNNMPFAFHRLRQSSSGGIASPLNSIPPSQNVSTTGSPTIGGPTAGTTGSGAAHPIISGQAAQLLGISSSLPSSPSVQPGSAQFANTNSTSSTSVAAQKFSAQLITLFTQHGVEAAPISSVATRMIVYLTHLLPFLTPRLVITDWWDRLIEPSLQGEIKLDKDALKACRDLVTECMIRDTILDTQRPGSGSLLVAGDEEGQLDILVAKASMPAPQFILRSYIITAHRLNHRLEDVDKSERELHADGSSLRTKPAQSHAGHGSGSSGFGFTTPTSNLHGTTHLSSEYPEIFQDMEKQHRLFSNARFILRRKKDILFRNLESILFSYGGGVGRVKDFFSCLYTYFVGARFRPEILGLLCQFVRRQRVHLHQILATPLFDSLLLSLKYDTSPEIVSLGSMSLIMLMPRILTALNDRLPEMFLILSRIICWPRSRLQLMAVTNQDGTNLTGHTMKSFDEFDDDENRSAGLAVSNDRSSGPEHDKMISEDIEYEDIPLHNYGLQWRRYGPSAPGGITEGAPDPTAVFTFLYGLFPCNLLKFLHSPREYMRQALTPSGSPNLGSEPQLGEGDPAIKSPEVTSPKDAMDKGLYIDEDLLKSRVQTLLKRHSLHPDLLTMTSEQEIVNKARWQKLEPMEIVAMCVGLDIWSAGGLNGVGPILRSIEDDRRGAVHDDSSEDSDDRETIVANTRSSRKMSSPSLETSTGTREQRLQSEALASVESLGSDDSAATPIEILTQEEFLGGRALKENQSQFIHSSPSPSHSRSHSGAARGMSRKMGAKSREVKMSHILRNFAILRGLDYEEFMIEAQNGRSLGPSITLKDRKSSLSSAPKFSTTSVPTAVGADHGDIPPEDSMALTTQSEAGQDSFHHPDTVASLVLQNQDLRKSILQLERDLLVSKNELNFELFLKQQHIQQISKVHRSHVLDASVEAERQNLYNTCRSLKAQLQETKLLLEKEKNELEKRKNKQTHWDTELKNKMQTFRDERKQLQFDLERLKQDIQDTRHEQEIQERLLTDERKGTFQLKNIIEDMSPKLKRMEEYEKRIEEMTKQLVLWESEQTKTLDMQHQLEVSASRWQNFQLLLSAEKEESRILRNRVSQQSQILDDMRIQLALHEGRGAEDMPSTPSMEHLSEDGDHGDNDLRHENGHEDEKVGSDERGGDADDQVSGVEGDNTNEHNQSLHRKSSNNLHHRRHVEVSWPTGFTRSNSSQQGFDHQRKSAAMQEFMVREKERWDRELQDAHTKWSKEAIRNQQLEDRILELQGQLEMARAIDMRRNSTFSGGQGGHGGQGGGNFGGNVNIGVDNGSGMHLMNFPSKPLNVPYAMGAGSSSRMRINDQFGYDDTDDDGFGSGMIGRFSKRHVDDDDDDDEDLNINPNILRSKSVSHATVGVTNSTAVGTSNFNTSHHIGQSSSTTDLKGETTKLRSKSNFPPHTTLERAQTDLGPYGSGETTVWQGHLGSAMPNILDLTRHSSSSLATSQRHSTKGGGSSTSTTRAGTGGLFPHLLHRRSNISDGGNSDITSASDTSHTAGIGAHDEHHDDDVDSGSGAVSETASASGSGTGSGKKKKVLTEKEIERNKEREKEREKERSQLMNGMGPLVNPSKMYRNVRMF